MKTLTAILFAGGESRRMGIDKATLHIEDEPLWSRQLRILRELQPAEIMISARCRPAWCPPKIETILDQTPSHGPLSGLAAVLTAIRTSHVLALAIDLPLMKSNYLRQLWKQCDKHYGVVPADGNSYEPLCAIYPASATNMVVAALSGDNYSLKNTINLLIAASLLRITLVEPDNQRMFLNLNTSAEFFALNS